MTDVVDRLSELVPCPFCGAGETHIITNDYWTGMRNKVISAKVQHHCNYSNHKPLIQISGKDVDQAIFRWNMSML